jgi:hypothetical protein
MLIGSMTAAQLCGVSKQRFHQLAKLLRLRPVAKRKGGVGVPESQWSISQLSAMLALPQLVRCGADEDEAASFCKRFAATSDELQEARINDGICWVLIAGPNVCPDLLPRQAAEATVLKRAEQLNKLRIVPSIVDLGSCYLELLEAARAHVRAESEQDA